MFTAVVRLSWPQRFWITYRYWNARMDILHYIWTFLNEKYHDLQLNYKHAFTFHLFSKVFFRSGFLVRHYYWSPSVWLKELFRHPLDSWMWLDKMPARVIFAALCWSLGEYRNSQLNTVFIITLTSIIFILPVVYNNCICRGGLVALKVLGWSLNYSKILHPTLYLATPALHCSLLNKFWLFAQFHPLH